MSQVTAHLCKTPRFLIVQQTCVHGKSSYWRSSRIGWRSRKMYRRRHLHQNLASYADQIGFDYAHGGMNIPLVCTEIVVRTYCFVISHIRWPRRRKRVCGTYNVGWGVRWIPTQYLPHHLKMSHGDTLVENHAPYYTFYAVRTSQDIYDGSKIASLLGVKGSIYAGPI